MACLPALRALRIGGDAAVDPIAGTAPPVLEDFPAMGKIAGLIDCKSIE
jgi:hypothetical protein